MATLPENPTADQINEIFGILRMKFSNVELGIEMQKKYKVFDTSFGMKASAYHQLLEHLNKLPPNV